MGTTAAERQRRYRAHSKGDHSLCDPARRCDVTESVTPVTRAPAGPRLNTSGRQLWTELGGDEAAGGKRVLILEACRIADRLDKLDRLLSGDAQDWLDIVEAKGDPDRQEVVIDKPLAEARQQAIALKQIVSELRQGQAGAEPASQGGSFRDELAAARARRLADASGS